MHTELAYEAQKTLIKERSNTSLARRAQLVRGRPRPRPAIAIRVPGWRRVRIVVNRWQSGDVVLPGSQGEQAREPFGEPQPAEAVHRDRAPSTGGNDRSGAGSGDRGRAMKKRVVIVGAGFAGLELATRLSGHSRGRDSRHAR